VAEVLQARVRAVLVPFAAGGESEQTLRAQLLAERGICAMVEEAKLSPQRPLTAAVIQSLPVICQSSATRGSAIQFGTAHQHRTRG